MVPHPAAVPATTRGHRPRMGMSSDHPRDLNLNKAPAGELRAGSSSHDVTDTASCESLRLQLVELGLGDRPRVEELFGRRDLIGARAATACGDH
jgi:hypothetical protein